ncbi:SEC-C domain-containing protein [Klebsiella aerogenes]|uniref:SEC-C domain-containing protein n=1 Tax=Klebsiella aerogenes TaxID=548 RepID=UPI00227916A2|nr:SEC-C domain-containing protein [Klebsiella aerogenes]MCY4762664.1 SEC-C domain-containing protein [Klebsiella aerogenes]
MKLGRNDECWCKSGLKYKKCHLDRDKQKRMSTGEVMSFSKEISQRKKCYVPDTLTHECQKKIIKAHTVSKSSSLQSIADKTNHVLGLKMSIANIFANKGKIQPEKIGVNQASTFTGFCSYHDRVLFSCVENKDFVGTPEQCFALMFRALAKEIYAKEGACKISDFAKGADKGRGIVDQTFIQYTILMQQQGLDAAKKELYELKSVLDNILLSKNYHDIESLIITFSEPLPIAVSSLISPMEDFQGNEIQDLSNLSMIAAQVCFNVFSSKEKGYVVFSWVKGLHVIELFIKSLMKIEKQSLLDVLIKFCLSKAENTFISPDWWESLSEEQKEGVIKMIMSDIDAFSMGETEDFSSYNYGIKEIESIVSPWDGIEK